MTGSIVFDPLLPWALVWTLAGIAALALAASAWRRLAGWWLRGLAGLALLVAIANPSLQEEERRPLTDIVIALTDESASQHIGDRADQTDAALAALGRNVAGLPNTELRVVKVGDDTGNDMGDNLGDGGTRAMTALAAAMSEIPRGRIAGVVILSDGRIHDADIAPNIPAPVHLLQSGHADDWDRRLIVRNAPAFAIMGEPVTLTLRIEDQGAPQMPGPVSLAIAIDGAAPLLFDVPSGQDIELPISLPHGGMNVLQFSTPAQPGELTDRNNAAVIQINGVRDRLRVLLVSGEPYPGERTWRNLLKSDSGVDLVHFTILRPPEKQDGVPVDELSLIAFPTRELFLEKIDEFDLIVFDRYRRRGILPNAYLDNIRGYVERGGAVLIAAGPEYGSADSIYRSPLGMILPGAPTARVLEQGYLPLLTDLGQQHPVTEGLDTLMLPSGDTSEAPGWGRWLRLIEVDPSPEAQIVMAGPDERPLLLLDRVGEGRVALLASDQAWLWDRGFEGGGPQLELLRRLAHWMMKEPDLEEEALWAEPSGQTLRIIRRTIGDYPGDVTVTGPDGADTSVPLTLQTPGRFEALWNAPDPGLYRLQEGDKSAVIAVGPAAPREFEETIATDEILAPLIAQTNGGVVRMDDGAPTIRAVRPGRPAAGRGWIGITPRGAYLTENLRLLALVPAWLFLLLAAGLLLAAWLREGRR